ncbi:hypothetical protein LCGC14_2666050 [marine sediment metagenome]|uniref:Uncharacterized protein n=1 Tax=marine sediment metagenome TaxID=412755 RepID=A0A0F8ZQG5_9ZZZZ
MAGQVTHNGIINAVQANLIANITECQAGNVHIMPFPIFRSGFTSYEVQVCPNGMTADGGIIATSVGARLRGKIFSVRLGVFSVAPLDEANIKTNALTESTIGINQLVTKVENLLQAAYLRSELETAGLTALLEPLQLQSVSAPETNPEFPETLKVDLFFGAALSRFE